MRRKLSIAVLGAVGLLIVYLALWPVPVDPIPWNPPPNPGHSGPYAANTRLQGLQTFTIAPYHGAEDIALDGQGRIYAATHQGVIVRLAADGSNPQPWADTGGRPLGIDFDGSGNLIVADAFRGLLAIDPGGTVRLLADVAGGVPIRYADDVDVAADGRIWFSDASTKFGAKAVGDTLEASRLDLVEHGGHGRLLVYDPDTGKTATALDGLNFANGVAVAHDQQSVLVNETGSYRVLRYWIAGQQKGRTDVLVDGLPGFPDNISAGADGRYWIAFPSPRLPIMEALAGRPFLRKVVMRLPRFLQPGPLLYGHIIAIDDQGRVLEDLQDPGGAYPINTSVTETAAHLYLGSLVAPVLARLPKGRAGL